jgi:transposase
MRDWLASKGVTHVAMESTGVYWKPVWHVLEGSFDMTLVNAQHIKQVPGRKTDMKDSQWIAQLLQHGLLPKSFVPPTDIRELRDLTRMRAALMNNRVEIANRIQKVLEDANIKLASVATDITGVSCREMLKRLVNGESDPEKLAESARRRMRGKIPELKKALTGKVTTHHRFMLRLLLDQLSDHEKMVERLNAQIEEQMRPFEEQVSLLITIPGVAEIGAENIIAEIGADMSRFPSDKHLASWAGVCPGNNESAGKRKSGRTPKGNRWLRRTLGECGWAASRTKNTYLSAHYLRILPRRGKKRAVVAVGHSILVICYHLLKDKVPYRDLGADFFNKLDPERQKRYHVKKLEDLGYDVQVSTAA